MIEVLVPLEAGAAQRDDPQTQTGPGRLAGRQAAQQSGEGPYGYTSITAGGPPSMPGMTASSGISKPARRRRRK